jgi:hypothetical protein
VTAEHTYGGAEQNIMFLQQLAGGGLLLLREERSSVERNRERVGEKYFGRINLINK